MNILSLGGGVQSSTLLLMALQRETEPLDAVIFANTGWEPAAVYLNIEALRVRCGKANLPFYQVQAGNIREDTLRGTGNSSAQGEAARFATMPLHLKTSTGHGMLRRQCTQEYKVTPIRRKIREWGATAKKPVNLWIGISYDEWMRGKESNVKYIRNVYPLVDRSMTRHDCIDWLLTNGYPLPPKSACVCCPFKDNARWRDLQKNSPVEFAQAVEFDNSVRRLKRIHGEVYLHRSLIPLAEVDLRTDTERGQLDLFANDCEGICGV